MIKWLLPVAVPLAGVILAVTWKDPTLLSSSSSLWSSIDSIRTTFRSILSPDECSFDLAFFSLEDVHPQYTCTQDDLDSYLHDVKVPGMNLVCLHAHNRSITFYRGASKSSVETIISFGKEEIENGPESDGENAQDTSWKELKTWASMRSLLHFQLELYSGIPPVPMGPGRPKDNWKLGAKPQPWAAFSPTGQRLIQQDVTPCTSTRVLWETGMFIVMEGGQFHWPGVRVGFRREIAIASADADVTTTSVPARWRNATIETLSLNPLVLSVDDFVDDDECHWVQEKGAPKLKYSKRAMQGKDEGLPFSGFQTSSSAILNTIEPELQDLRRRIARLVRVPEIHLEPVTMAKYRIGEYFGPHHDYFDPTLYQNDPGTLRLLKNGYRNRMATVMIYLNDFPDDDNSELDKENGVTTFPLAGGGQEVPLEQACSTGLQVTPKKGKVILFYGSKGDGTVDPLSLNGDCPVKRGVKFSSIIWVWNEPILSARYA